MNAAIPSICYTLLKANHVSDLTALGIAAIAPALEAVVGVLRSRQVNIISLFVLGGLLVGLSNEDAARFAFLLATPIIGAAAALKLPELFGSQGNGVRGPALVGALCAAVTAYFSVRFLMRFFETNRLTPFAAYCLAAGLACTLYFAV